MQGQLLKKFKDIENLFETLNQSKSTKKVYSVL